MSANVLVVNTGLYHILTQVIGFNEEESHSIEGTIRSYSVPSKWLDIYGWLTYAASNVGHVVRRTLHWIAPCCIDESDWTKLEHHTYTHFSLAAARTSTTNIHWSELPSNLNQSETREKLMDNFSRMFRDVVYVLALLRAKNALALCLKAQTEGVTSQQVIERLATHNYSQIAMTGFLEEIREARVNFLERINN